MTGESLDLHLARFRVARHFPTHPLSHSGIDNGYRVTVVLAGTKNPLLEQNFTRLYNDLEARRPNLTPVQEPNSFKMLRSSEACFTAAVTPWL